MNRFKEYKNLYNVYRKIIRKCLIAFIVLIVLFILSFMLIMFGMPIDIMFAVVIFFFGAIAAGIICLLVGPLTAKQLAQFDPPALSRINETLPTIKMQDGFGVTGDAIVVVRAVRLFLYPVKNALWIYKNVTTTMLYGFIPIHKGSSLVVAGKNRKSFSIGIRNKSEVVDFLQSELEKFRRGIFYGFNDELSSLYYNHIDKMIAMSAEYDSQYNEMTFENGQV